MKINEKVLSIPPYISTTWANIASIRMKASQLSITLTDGDSINIPCLEKEIIDLIFKTHVEQIEKNNFQELNIKKNRLEMETKHLSSLFGENEARELPIGFGFATLDGFNTIMQHNPQEMNAPDLPNVLLDKIESIAKMMTPEESVLLPKEIPNCNCFHCQITKTINHFAEKKSDFNELILVPIDEEVTDLDLQFNQWDVSNTGDNLFNVTNKLDALEQYTVFLGTPVGCNCGHQNCEHIIAVLKT